MAKKKQPKQPSMADFDNATPPAFKTTNQPAYTTQVPAMLCHSFFNFFTLVTMDDIKNFLKCAATTPEGENLIYLWKRAYEKGYESGKKSLLQNLEREMEEMFEEGVAKWMNLGHEEGYTIAKDSFDKIIKAVKARETLKASTNSTSTQTDSATTMTTVSMQTNPVPTTPSVSTSTIGTQTNTTMSQLLKIGPPTRIVTSQSPVPYGNREFDQILLYSENSPKFDGFSLPMPSLIISNSLAPSPITTALETHQKMANFTLKSKTIENSPISTQTTFQTPAPSIFEATNGLLQLNTSPKSLNNNALQSITLTTAASTSQPSVLSATSGDKKRASLSAVLKLQSSIGSREHTSIAKALETCLKTVEFEKFDQKLEKSPILEHFSWVDDTISLPMTSTLPTKYPHNISCLCSTSTCPFLSLQCQCCCSKNQWNAQCHHTSHSPSHGSPPSHTLCHSHHPPQPHILTLLN